MGHFENRLSDVLERQRPPWSMQFLADEIGKHRNTIVNFREAKRVDLETLTDICNALGAPPWEILVWVEDRPEGIMVSTTATTAGYDDLFTQIYQEGRDPTEAIEEFQLVTGVTREAVNQALYRRRNTRTWTPIDNDPLEE